LAWQHTLADVGIKFMADVKIGNAISYAVGGGGVAYGAVQKKLRRDTIQKMGSHIKTLEKTVDANRSPVASRIAAQRGRRTNYE